MTARAQHSSPEKEELPLSKAAEYLLEECRMVLPGIQALFGFQLIAVFNSGFEDKLDPAQRSLHLLAIGLACVAIVLIMAPAALHRQTDPRAVTKSFVDVSTRLLLWSMAPLAFSVCIDFYLVAQIIVDNTLGALLAAMLVAIFAVLWVVLPRVRRIQSAIGGSAFPLEGRELIEQVRRGGYVIFLRHARTDPDGADTDPFDLDNTKDQRQLTEEGRKDAAALGRAWRALGIPIDRVLTGEFCRTRETASLLAVGDISCSLDLTEGGIVVSERENQRRAKALRKLLATVPPEGRNTLIVGHNTNLEDAAGKEFGDIQEGEAIVFRPLGRDRFEAVARVEPPKKWLEWAKSARRQHADEARLAAE
jgi:phosphohistidine phosphatase SixA